MKEAYKKLTELEDFYIDMRKKYPLTKDIWNELLKLVDKHKSKILNKD